MCGALGPAGAICGPYNGGVGAGVCVGPWLLERGGGNKSTIPWRATNYVNCVVVAVKRKRIPRPRGRRDCRSRVRRVARGRGILRMCCLTLLGSAIELMSFALPLGWTRRKGAPNSGSRARKTSWMLRDTHAWKGRRRLFQQGRMVNVAPRWGRSFPPAGNRGISPWPGLRKLGNWAIGRNATSSVRRRGRSAESSG